MTEDRIESLRRAVEAHPEDGTLRLILAEALADSGRRAEALREYERLLRGDVLGADEMLRVGQLAADEQRLDLLQACLARLRELGVVEGVGNLQARADRLLAERGLVQVRADGADDPYGDGMLPAAETTTFDQIGGLADVKKAIHRRIILPQSRPGLFRRYRRQAGGGVLLYGPPGCGKTLLARATAGECGLPFLNVRIEDVVDPYQGVSERNLHTAFEHARSIAPCVLFIDELDGLAYARHKQGGSSTRRLVDVLLQELDAIGSDNTGVLVLAATNVPWDVDEATLRPGRFDRVIFVPPPDEAARVEILRVLLRDVPCEGVDLRRLAAATPLFSGADLRALVEQACDEVIEEALAGGGEPPLTMRHLENAVRQVRPTTLDWLYRAEAYVEFANAAERYADVAKYLANRDVRRRLNRHRELRPGS
ncbi:AAA family ATPase [Carbonactinospora thermoautotrophica]|uniref:AAA family ATPase n=1 Tax=Carbonactinospora thermoautotrophica TaxID=1469144 RepID=UPI003DA8848C